MIPARAEEIANEIRLTRAQHQGSFLLVEGRDDRLFMEAFISRQKCRIFVAESKDRVYDVIRILDVDGFRGALGLVDADFDRVLGVADSSANVVRYAYHDLEAMLLFSPALQRVLVEFGSRTKIASRGGEVMTLLLDRAFQLGFLRLASVKSTLHVKFDGLKYSMWIDKSSLDWSFPSLIEAIRNCSQHSQLNTHHCSREVQKLSEQGFDIREVCVGVDLIAILSIALRSVLGTNNASKVSDDVLRRSLRLAYSSDEFARSSLSGDIRVWESSNQLYRILSS